MDIKEVRTRFAPSPTGKLHFGNANTALFNWLLARKYGGTVVVRVEDTDIERSSKEFEQGVLDDLAWLGIDWDEGPGKGGDFGPYHQSERTDIYMEHLAKLFEINAVYRCYCTKEELEIEHQAAQKEKRDLVYSGKCRNLTPDDWARLDAEGKSYTVRFKTPSDEKVIVKDLIRGDIEFNTNELDDFILIRSNGIPVFLLTNAIDDALMKISHVVRGEDHISNTPKQVLINKVLGLKVPEYLHTAIILGKDKTKLSKRHGAVSIFQFRDLGYLPEALVNYLSFLGWNPKDDREFFSIDELKEAYSVEAMGKSPSVFDYDRLKYLNSHWMQQISDERKFDIAVSHFIEKGWIDEAQVELKKEWLKDMIEILGDRFRSYEDLEINTDFFFTDFNEYAEKGIKKHFKGEETVNTLTLLLEALSGIEEYNRHTIEDVMRDLVEKHEIKGKLIIHPTRLALSGKIVGPGLFELMEILGKEKCIVRLELAIDWIRQNKM